MQPLSKLEKIEWLSAIAIEIYLQVSALAGKAKIGKAKNLKAGWKLKTCLEARVHLAHLNEATPAEKGAAHCRSLLVEQVRKISSG